MEKNAIWTTEEPKQWKKIEYTDFLERFMFLHSDSLH